MKIDVTELMNGRFSSINFEYTASPEDCKNLAEMLPESVKLQEKGVFVSGTVSETGGYMSLHADVTVKYTAECDRCLDETEYTLCFPLDRVVSAAASPEARERMVTEDEEEWDGVTDDLIYVDGGKIDITEDISEAAALELPFRHLCSEDCRGLCPVCGKKLSEEHQGCETKKEIDPRLAILQKLLDKSE